MAKSFALYTATDRLRDIIDDNNQLLMAISRFGISLGFGDRTIADVCKSNGVDCKTFLAVVNFISKKKNPPTEVSLVSLMNYLESAHTYFLEFLLPSIRRKLIEAINCRDDDDNVAMLLLKFFDNYVNEVENHMKYENDHVFAYVNELLDNRVNKKMTIANYSAHHNGIGAKLKELKDIIIRYYPQNNRDLINSVLFDIIVCEQDLVTHCDIEDTLFTPEVAKLEETLKSHLVETGGEADESPSDEEKVEALTDREKEIIRCVAKGLPNKEIADALCLSVHTVATHRRNLSAKLDIHTPAGLTIFAILNNLVTLDEVKHLK
jgi:regulator of cell morphogenesis and NO signaling